MYMGGTPLFDERTGERTDRLVFVYRRHAEARAACQPDAVVLPANPRRSVAAPRKLRRGPRGWALPAARSRVAARDRPGRTSLPPGRRSSRTGPCGARAPQAASGRLRRAGHGVVGAGSLRGPGPRPVLRAADVHDARWVDPRRAGVDRLVRPRGPLRGRRLRHHAHVQRGQLPGRGSPARRPRGDLRHPLPGPALHGLRDREAAVRRRAAEPAARHAAALHHPLRDPLSQAAGHPAAAAHPPHHHPAGPDPAAAGPGGRFADRALVLGPQRHHRLRAGVPERA